MSRDEGWPGSVTWCDVDRVSSSSSLLAYMVCNSSCSVISNNSVSSSCTLYACVDNKFAFPRPSVPRRILATSPDADSIASNLERPYRQVRRQSHGQGTPLASSQTIDSSESQVRQLPVTNWGRSHGKRANRRAAESERRR